MTFCSAYIKNASSIGVRSNRNDDLEYGLSEGRPISKGKEKILEDHVLQAAHRYVLFNTAEVEPYLLLLNNIQKMSKMVKKRSKGSVDEIQENISSRLSRMDSNNSANSSHDLHGKEPIDDEITYKKKGRGASKLKMVSGQDKCKELERNEFGQLVGDNSVKYASFLGCMIKEFVPYTLNGWNDISEEVKDSMWSCLQEKSERFRAMRKKQNHIHTMSRRGYARLTHIMEKRSPADTKITRSQVWIEGHKRKNGEPSTQVVGEKMEEIQECPPDSQNTTNIVDDAISLVFGKEARGRVRGMGFGVTPSKVGASVKQNGIVQQLQTMVQSLQQQMQQNQLEMQEMRSMFLQSMNKQNQQEQVVSSGIGSGIGNEVGSNGNIDIGAKKSGDFDHVSQSDLRNASSGDIRANTKCKLLHWCADELVVAEGRIASTDPNTKVHHVVLGRSC
ncbi:uncharacterized protein [Primulina eburnea]|uniref:uncharacterized protein isoform X4 n=1 Tax=Primulina eburnea TaxID=1245227 RepID=UPI003C6BF9EF